jgi:hypothetical protein
MHAVQRRRDSADLIRGCTVMTALTLIALEDVLAISKLPADAPLPPWASGCPFVSITRTPDELSIVCREAVLPLDVNSERGWRCLRVAGPLAFSSVGILASLVEPMAKAGIPVFVVSTFNTDYVLLKAGDFDRAVEHLQQAGHMISC